MHVWNKIDRWLGLRNSCSRYWLINFHTSPRTYFVSKSLLVRVSIASCLRFRTYINDREQLMQATCVLNVIFFLMNCVLNVIALTEPGGKLSKLILLFQTMNVRYLYIFAVTKTNLIIIVRPKTASCPASLDQKYCSDQSPVRIHTGPHF